jgi:integrase/recombinase XerD
MTVVTLRRLDRDIKAHLEFKRALGCSYNRNEYTLHNFERFAQAMAGNQKSTVIDLAQTIKAWLLRGKGRSPNTLKHDLSIVRQLCLYRRRSDPKSFVPSRVLAPGRVSTFVPHIFSHEEIVKLLAAAAKPRRYNAKIPAMTVHTLMLVLYCTGLRFGEAARLLTADVDLSNRTLLVRESKGRTRIVPFGDDLAREIRRYLSQSSRYVEPGQLRKSLFIDRFGKPVNAASLSALFTRLLRKEGLKPPRGRIGPRPYDFRHAFAVHRLVDWYRQGVDIYASLPLLSAYMGHVDVLDTEVYLHATPELLKLASERLRSRLAF